MKFEQILSSSKANLYMVTASNGKRLMLECGATWAKIQKALNYDLSNIEACLVTHCHLDHCKAIREVMQAGINVYASGGTIEALGLRGERRAITIPVIEPRVLGKTFTITSWPANHDAVEPFYFVIDCDGEYIIFAPDTSHIKQRFNIPFSIIAIECSFDLTILQKNVDSGDINEIVAKRLLTSHMEKLNTLRYLSQFCNLYKCREIHLLHMSGGNIDKEKTRKEFQDKLFIEVKII